MNWSQILGGFLVLVFVIAILWVILPGVTKYANDETQRELLKEVSEEHKMMCGIPEEINVIFDKMDSISTDNFDNRARGIYQTITWGNDVESCDVLYLYNQLDNEQKKKLNWMELSCTVSHCLVE